MKNQIMKMKKSEGFISIETILVAGIVVTVGVVAYNVLYNGSLGAKVTAAKGRLATDGVAASDLQMTANV